MKFTQSCIIAAHRETLWNFLMDTEKVARCLSGVEGVTRLDNDTYEGTLKVKVGPVSLTLQGTLRVEARDQECWHGAMKADARDRKLGGGVRASMSMDLREKGPGKTEMLVALDAQIYGKMGEFRQELIKKKADTMMVEFSENVSRQLGMIE